MNEDFVVYINYLTKYIGGIQMEFKFAHNNIKFNIFNFHIHTSANSISQYLFLHKKHRLNLFGGFEAEAAFICPCAKRFSRTCRSEPPKCCAKTSSRAARYASRRSKASRRKSSRSSAVWPTKARSSSAARVACK